MKFHWMIICIYWGAVAGLVATATIAGCHSIAHAADLSTPLWLIGPAQCNIQEDMEKEISNSGEHEIGMGVTSHDTVIRVLKGNDGGFTVVEMRPNGYSCVLGSGTDWNVEKDGGPT